MQDLEKALNVLNIKIEPTHFQGIVCGFLATGEKPQDWLAELIGHRDKNNLSVKSAVLFLAKFIDENLQQLTSQNFNFKLMIQEEKPIKIRIKQMSSWCDGFLYGFGLSKTKTSENSEISQILNDFSQFTRVNLEEETKSNKSNELDLIEIVEYIKVSVLLIFSELNKGLN